jgi:prenyltransferase beta subunit
MRWRIPTLALLALSASAFGQPTDKEAIRYLQARQTREGGFTSDVKDTTPTLRATSGAIRALRYLGGSVDNPDGAKKFVASCFDRESGGFRPTPGEGKPDCFTTAVGIMAVVELKMPLAEYEKPVMEFFEMNAKTFEEIRIAAAGLEAMGRSSAKTKDWLKTLAEMRNDDGTFGKDQDRPRATGSAVACQLRLGEQLTTKNRVDILVVLRLGQGSDGGYGKADAKASDLETTYRVMRALKMLGSKPDVEKLKGFIAKCRNDDGGYGVTPGAPSTVSGTYYAGIIKYWFK